MVLTPRFTTRSGLSRQGTLLLVLAGGLALGLLVLLPRLATSRAAESGSRRVATQEPRGDAPSSASLATEAPPAALQALPEVESEAEQPVPNGSEAPAALVAASAESGAPTKPEAPKLKYERGGGKSGLVAPGALRAEQREQREQRLAREAAEAAALGLPPPPQPKMAAPTPSRERLDQLEMGPKRNGQQRGKAGAKGGKNGGKGGKGKNKPSAPKDS